MMLKAFLSIEDIFNMVTQDERQKNIKPSAKVENVVFQTSNTTRENSSVENMAYAASVQNRFRLRSSRPVCTHYGQMGHVVQKCFKIHG